MKAFARKKPDDMRFDQGVKPLKRGGQSFIAVASAKLANKSFGSSAAYHAALKATIAEVKMDGSTRGCERGLYRKLIE